MDVVESPGDEEWDEFCEASPAAWFWHTTAWRDYTLAYRPDLESRSRAFFVTDRDHVLAAVPLMVERAEGTAHLSFGGGDCWAPALAPGLSPACMSEALRAALSHVDRVAKRENATRASFRLSPLVSGFETWLPFLAETTRAGYGDVSATTTIVDLSQSTEEIMRRMTKGHRSDIIRMSRSLTVDVIDSGNVTAAGFDEYRLLHERAAGRVTRPARTFELMQEWINTETGLLLTARSDGRAVSCAYLSLFGAGAYYSSAATEPTVRLPAGHLLQWSAIEWLKTHGYRRYELGLQQFGPLPHDVPSAKELNIARFKRGFGGDLVPVPVREKWFDANSYRAVTAERTASYLAAVAKER